MIGIDIVEISRFNKLNDGAFLAKVFNEVEINYIAKKSNSIATVAGMFALKEAVLKALGCGIGNGISLKDIVINYSELGQPRVVLSENCNKYLTEFNCTQVYVSISHSDTTAVGVAILTK